MDRLNLEKLERLALSGQISRRDLMKRAALLGLSAPIVAGLLAACGDDDDDDDDGAPVVEPTEEPDDEPVDEDDDEPTEEPDEDDDEPTDEPDDDDRRGGSVTIVYSPTIIELDVSARNVGTLNEVSHYYYETLIDRNEDLEFHGLLAREMQISDDGLVHTFMLQENVTFHDGAPFNAEAVVWNVNRKMDNQLVLYDLLPLEEVRAVDEYTVEIELTRPSPGVYGLLATRPWSMFNPEWVDSVPIETLSEDVNGTGPFRMVEYVPNEIMRLERNDDYWQEGLPYLDEVIFRVVPDINTRATMLETGEAQIALALTMQDIDRFENTSGGPKVLEGAGSLQYYIPMNMVRFPTEELEVRHAINYAIDKEGIIQSVFLGRYATIADAVYLPPIMEGHSSAGVYDYDPDRARQILDDAGWTVNGDGIRERDGEPLSVVFLTRRGQVTGDFEIAELIQAMLQEIGVDCQVELQESATFLDAATVPSDEATYNMLNLTVRTVTLDAEYTMLTFYSCDSRAPRYFNRAYLCDEQIDEWIEESFTAPTLEERNAMYVDIIRRVHELAPIVQLFDSIETVAVAENLEGVYYDPAHVNWPAKYAWLS